MDKNTYFRGGACFFLLPIVFILSPTHLRAQSALPCYACHSGENDNWLLGRHANTQKDVAGEIAANWQGQTPDSVIHGSAAENCVACHSPLAVTTNGGMTETQVMGHYFTTTGGFYTDSTQAADTANWPHVGCNTCHDVPSNHTSHVLPTLAIFNSTTAQYDSMPTTATLCGQCHGTLRFAETDHRIFDAWKLSRHGHRGQSDVAGELAGSWAGKTPNDVINGPDAENCVACHAPTAVGQKSGDTTEVMVLSRFFTTSGGQFTAGTAPSDTAHWPDVSCTACHDPHRPDTLSYYNTSTRTYQVMASSNQLCGQCHGNLRFAGTDHLSYNVEEAIGGVGVAAQATMPGAGCTDCHMHKGETDGTNSLMYKGHSWSIFIHEPDSSTTASCTSCHAGMNADSSKTVIAGWKAEFASTDSLAQLRVASADSALQGITDSVRQAYLAEAKSNLSLAESDESGGFHNHKYSMALLNDAIAKSALITGVTMPQANLPLRFALHQNYPNPFNPSTIIRYEIPLESRVALKVYNVLGQTVAILRENVESAGYKIVEWTAAGMPSGIYFCQLQATSTSHPVKAYSQVMKMLLIR